MKCSTCGNELIQDSPCDVSCPLGCGRLKSNPNRTANREADRSEALAELDGQLRMLGMAIVATNQLRNRYMALRDAVATDDVKKAGDVYTALEVQKNVSVAFVTIAMTGVGAINTAAEFLDSIPKKAA